MYLLNTKMTTNWQEIKIESRAFKHYASMAVKNVIDAVIELTTNSTDAYSRQVMDGEIQPTDTKRFILGLSTGQLVYAIDNACGLSATQMSVAFLQAGNYTARRGTRGFFSTGAKHICTLGLVTFTSVKSGLLSVCQINSDGRGAVVVADRPVTQEERDLYEIPENGTHVKIDLLPQYWLQTPERELEMIIKHFALRDILTNPTVIALGRVVDPDTTEILSERSMTYVYPDAEQNFYRLKFRVPGYPEAGEAEFVVHKARTAIASPETENQLEFGFLIKSEGGICSVTCLRDKFRTDANMSRFFGYIRSDYISQLMYDFDQRSIDTPATEAVKNPSTILDPTRSNGGINIGHPFIRQLFSIPVTRLELFLAEMTERSASDFLLSDDINEVINSIEDFGSKLVETDETLFRWRQQQYGQIILASRDHDANYVTVEEDNSGLLKNFREVTNAIPAERLELWKKSLNQKEGCNLLDPLEGEIEPPETRDLGLDEMTNFQLKKPTFRITFDDQNENPEYKTHCYQNREKIFLQVNLRDPLVRLYIQKTPEHKIILAPHGLAMFIDLIIDAFAWMICRANAEKNSRLMSNISSFECSLSEFRAYQGAIRRIQLSLHDVIFAKRKQFFDNVE
jgi:hypothetical protein